MYFIFLHNVEEYKYKKACKVHFNSDVIHYIDHNQCSTLQQVLEKLFILITLAAERRWTRRRLPSREDSRVMH